MATVYFLFLGLYNVAYIKPHLVHITINSVNALFFHAKLGPTTTMCMDGYGAQCTEQRLLGSQSIR